MIAIFMVGITSLTIVACLDSEEVELQRSAELLDDATETIPPDALMTTDVATALASGAPVIFRSPANQPIGKATSVVIGHRCNELGGDGTTEGVHCADVAYVENASGWEVWPVGQALCQTVSGGALRQCAGIRQNVGLYTPGLQLAGRQANCGRFGGSACPATVRFQNSAPHVQLRVSATCFEVWAAMVNDVIVLPGSARTVGPGPNVASSHVFFCNSLRPQPTPQP